MKLINNLDNLIVITLYRLFFLSKYGHSAVRDKQHLKLSYNR